MIDGISKIPMPERTAAAAAKKAEAKSKRLGEIAGGAAAGCAAVVCCCPCGLIGLIILTAARVPAEIGRRIARKRKRRAVPGLQKSLNSVAPASMTAEVWPEKSPAVEVSEMEEKMWAQFSGTGFWRSPSQRE